MYFLRIRMDHLLYNNVAIFFAEIYSFIIIYDPIKTEKNI